MSSRGVLASVRLILPPDGVPSIPTMGVGEILLVDAPNDWTGHLVVARFPGGWFVSHGGLHGAAAAFVPDKEVVDGG